LINVTEKVLEPPEFTRHFYAWNVKEDVQSVLYSSDIP
jgi:hypothetical protein